MASNPTPHALLDFREKFLDINDLIHMKTESQMNQP